MVNNMNDEALLSVVAEWLEETELSELVPRHIPELNLENLRRVLAIVGPRRAGKTFLMYQLIAALEQGGRADRRDILLVDFEDYRLAVLLHLVAAARGDAQLLRQVLGDRLLFHPLGDVDRDLAGENWGK